jgi:hypothetical protein
MNKIIKIILIFVLFFLCFNCNSIIEKFINDDYILPKVIFCFWHDSKNKLMNTFINNWKKNISKEWTISFINNSNIHNFVSKEFIEKYSELEMFRFSDFLRLELLKKYGGVWIDISTAIINGNFLDQYYDEMINNKYDICLYELKKNTTSESQPYLENWFLMAPKNSKFINDLYDQFEKGRAMDFYIYKKNILIPSGIDISKTLGYGEHYTYLMQHAIIHYLLKIGNQYKINRKDADESFFKLHTKLNWDNDKIINNFLNNDNWSDYYAIKFCFHQRRSIKNEEEFIKRITLL